MIRETCKRDILQKSISFLRESLIIIGQRMIPTDNELRRAKTKLLTYSKLTIMEQDPE